MKKIPLTQGNHKRFHSNSLFWRATLEDCRILMTEHWHGDNPSKWVDTFASPDEALEAWKNLDVPLSPAELYHSE